MTYLESLQDEIRRQYGCDGLHVSSEPVTEVHEGRAVWQGTVEVFVLLGHATAERCFVWTEADGPERTRFITVLEVSPIDSPQAAVRHIVSGRRIFAKAAANSFGVLKPEALAVPGGWRMGRMLDGEFMGWLCRHVHPTEEDAEACEHWSAYLCEGP